MHLDTHQYFCFILSFSSFSFLSFLIFDVSLVSKTVLTNISYKVLSVIPCVLIGACARVLLNMVNHGSYRQV